jgi:glycosyltransferase involved in cell wall biosynthesis
LALDAGVSVKLDLIGDGREYAAFRQLAAALALSEDAVRFHGRVENTRARTMLLDHHVGVIPHLADESWNTTIPNKLFDYMAAGLAVLASDAVPTKRVVTETGCGVTYSSHSAEDLARAIGLLASRAHAAAAASAGMRAVRDRYNWETDSSAMLSALKRVLHRYASRPGLSS